MLAAGQEGIRVPPHWAPTPAWATPTAQASFAVTAVAPVVTAATSVDTASSAVADAVATATPSSADTTSSAPSTTASTGAMVIYEAPSTTDGNDENVAAVGSWPSGDEVSRQMGQGSRADLLALV